MQLQFVVGGRGVVVGRGYREGTAIGLGRAGREAAVGRASLCYKNYVLKFDQEAEMAKRVSALSLSLSFKFARESASSNGWLLNGCQRAGCYITCSLSCCKHSFGIFIAVF